MTRRIGPGFASSLWYLVCWVWAGRHYLCVANRGRIIVGGLELTLFPLFDRGGIGSRHSWAGLSDVRRRRHGGFAASHGWSGGSDGDSEEDRLEDPCAAAETVPMSEEDEEQAVQAIAFMIEQWWQARHGNMPAPTPAEPTPDHDVTRRRTGETTTSGP